ncbi:UNVERIFIED_CONTAM: hypothetical protein GTU68_048362 [Idotea baltica]|nr:hypothetical protein [Idotea baltica]
MALAFVPVVGSLVDDVIMPIVARIFGQPDFSSLSIGLGGLQEEPSIMYGQFINTILSFIIIGFVIFMLVKMYNRATNKVEEEDGPSEIDLLTEIRDGLSKA